MVENTSSAVFSSTCGRLILSLLTKARVVNISCLLVQNDVNSFNRTDYFEYYVFHVVCYWWLMFIEYLINVSHGEASNWKSRKSLAIWLKISLITFELNYWFRFFDEISTNFNFSKFFGNFVNFYFKWNEKI